MKIPARKITVEWLDGSKTTHESVNDGIDVARIFGSIKESAAGLQGILGEGGLVGSLSGLKIGNVIKLGLKFLGL